MSAGGQYLRRLLDTRAGRNTGVPDAARVPDRPPGRVAVIVAVAGGGGMRTPLMISGLIERRARLAVERVVLYDTDPDALHLVKTLADALLVRSGRPFALQTTTSPAGAFDGASFVITSVRVGGLAGRIIDEQVPLAYGVVGQETTGPGGWAMALRTIPVLTDLVARVRRRAPEAWVINFTNPAGLIAQPPTASGETRAEDVADVAARLRTSALEAVTRGEDPLPVYEAAIFARRSSYMATETGQRRDLAMMGGHVEGGYARAALDVIEAMLHPQSRELIVNTVNQGAIADLDDADVVEVPSRIGPDGPDPRSMGGLPVAERDLVLRVKAYERATVAAALHRSWREAVAALALHPLVPSPEVGERIAGEYRRRHGPSLGYLD